MLAFQIVVLMLILYWLRLNVPFIRLNDMLTVLFWMTVDALTVKEVK